MEMKKRISKILITLFVVTALFSSAIGFTACNGSELADTLIVGTTNTVDTLNRLDAGGGRPGYAYTMISSTLAQIPIVYRSDDVYGSVICDIENSEDGLIWTFKLKEGFYWHDGEAVSAEDIKYTLENTLSADDVESIEIIDGAVNVVLKNATVTFLDGLISAIVAPKHILEGVTKDTITDEQSVIGCGPFRFVERNTDSGTIVFEKFDKYPYATEIALERVIFKQYNSTDSMHLALKAGEIDMIWNYGGGLDANGYSDLSREDNLQIVSYATNAVPKALFFNNQKMTDARVKNAIKKAIDYEKIARIFGTPESSLPREGFVAPHIFGYKETAELTRDLNGAKSLLLEAGYSESDKFSFELLVRSGSDDTQYADLIKTDLEETGMINVTLVIKGSDWQSYYQEGRHMASLAGITAAGYNFEAGYATRYLLTTENSVMESAGYAKNPVGHGQLEIEDELGNLTEFGLIRQALADAVKADEALKKAVEAYQDYFVENTPAIALIYDKKVQVMSKNIRGYSVDNTFGLLNVQSFTTLEKSV